MKEGSNYGGSIQVSGLEAMEEQESQPDSHSLRLSESEQDGSSRCGSPQTLSGEAAQDSVPTMEQEVVILVVGKSEKDKAGVAKALTQGDARAWAAGKVADVPMFSRKSPPRRVVDTTPLQYIKDRSPTAMSRRWISRNSLRRIAQGKHVFVVCVITCSVVKEPCYGSVFNNDPCWVDVFGLIFKDHKASILIVVNTEGNAVDEATKSQVKHFVMEHGFASKNIIYSDLSKGHGPVKTAVEESVSLGNFRRHSKLSRLFSTMKELRRVSSDKEKPATYNAAPFFMKEVSDRLDIGPWGPERVILFGRTGSGKSTLAQMLSLGRLQSNSRGFNPSSGVRGGTKNIEHGVGRGWYVVDTPGFGEPDKDKGSSVTTQKVQDKIKRFVGWTEGTFSHYLYVVKKERLDDLEEALWKFFVKLFGEEIRYQFSVVVSDADKDWMKANDAALKECFVGCTSFLCAEFPPLTVDKNLTVSKEELETELEEVRTESLGELEEDLSRLGRSDVHCKWGQHSKMHHMMERERANIDATIEKDVRIKILLGGSNIVFSLTDPIARWFKTTLRTDSCCLELCL